MAYFQAYSATNMRTLGLGNINPADFQSVFEPAVTLTDGSISYDYGTLDDGYNETVYGSFAYEYDEESLEYLGVSGTVTQFSYMWWYHDYDTGLGEYYSGGFDISGFSIDVSTYISLPSSTLTSQIFSGDDTIKGSKYGDVLLGFAGRDLIEANAGNDTLNGGTGEDLMFGGAGDDKYYVDNARDVVWEYAGEGIDTVETTVSYSLISNVEKLVLAGAKTINGTGNDLRNVLFGNAAANILDGKGGADTMSGGSGNDTYVVDSTGDRIVETVGAGIDLVRSSVSYALAANVENLTLTGSSAINGTGNALANVMTGNGANNFFDGKAGNDAIVGGGGADTLLGGAGADKLTGGVGADVFLFRAISETTVASSGRDTIVDFNRGQGDKIGLKGIDASTKLSGDQAFTFIGENVFSKKAGELRYLNKSGDTYINGDVNGDGKADFSIRLDTGIELVKGDFIL